MEAVCRNAESLCQDFCERLRGRIGEHRFATWFTGAVQIEFAGSEDQPTTVRLTVASAFEQSLIRQQLADDLQETAHELLGREGRVKFAVGQGVAAAPPLSVQRPGAGSARVADCHLVEGTRGAGRGQHDQAVAVAASRPRSNDAQLGEWVEGRENAAAARVCRRLIAGEPAPCPVLLWGPAGVGKTHLARAVAAGLRGRRRRVASVNAEAFIRAFVSAARSGEMPAFQQKHAAVDLLVIDDLQHLVGKTRTLEEFRQTLDTVAEAGGRIVLTADRGPAELRDLGAEVASRLAGGVSVELSTPGVAVREGLARQAARRVGLDLPERVARALACRLIGGAREVSGAVHRMALLHETFDSVVDERLAYQVADDTNRLSTPPVRLSDIQRAVCGVFGIDPKSLKSDKRTKAVTEPRMLAMWLARKMTGSAWSEIGDHFGRRSHSTVIAAHKRVERLLASAEPTRLATGELGETIRRVEAALRSA